MTGVIFDIKKFAIHDGPGIRTTVFLKGCPLDCWWCHNPEGISGRPEPSLKKNSNGSNKILGKKMTVDELMQELVKDEIFYDQSGGGVTFSGGEPMMQADFLNAALIACKKLGLATAIDTTGYAKSERFEQVYDSSDLFLYDLKLIDDNDHQKFTGVSNKLILENLRMLSSRGNKVRIRLPLIPQITDTDENLHRTLNFLSTLNNISDIGLLPYNRLSEAKLDRFQSNPRLGSLEVQSEERLAECRKVFTDRGYRVKVGG